MKNVPFILITGFLGSGKTTLLKRIVERHAGTMKLLVVQNEFAQCGVDAQELRRTGKPFEIVEINRGSVFCVCLLSDFIETLSGLLDTHAPGAVVLEATGLADPIAVAQLVSEAALKGRTYLHRVFCVVDASTFTKMEPVVGRITHQVRVADTVLINKIDLAGSPSTSVRERIAEQNPFARIIETTECDVDLDGLFEPPGGEPVAVLRAREGGAVVPGGRPDIGSAVLRFAGPLPQEKARAFFSLMENRCWRMKGHFRRPDETCAAIQSCFGHTEIREIGPFSGPGEIVCIGPDIEQQAVRAAFESAAAVPSAVYV
jgi:G3E family GTPase